MEKLEPSDTAGGDVKWCSAATLESSLAASQKVKQRVTIQAIPLMGIYSTEMKTSCSPKNLYINFIAALLIIAKK